MHSPASSSSYNCWLRGLSYLEKKESADYMIRFEKCVCGSSHSCFGMNLKIKEILHGTGVWRSFVARLEFTPLVLSWRNMLEMKNFLIITWPDSKRSFNFTISILFSKSSFLHTKKRFFDDLHEFLSSRSDYPVTFQTSCYTVDQDSYGLVHSWTSISEKIQYQELKWYGISSYVLIFLTVIETVKGL